MSDATLRAESKQTVRHPIGKIRITWTDPLIDASIDATVSEANYISWPKQCADLIKEVPKKWLHSNDADVVLSTGEWWPAPSTEESARLNQMGWWGEFPCDGAGDWAVGFEPTLTLDFADRLVEGFVVAGDSALGQYPVDFTVTVEQKLLGGYVVNETVNITGNTLIEYSQNFSKAYNKTSRTTLKVSKWSTPGKVVKIAEFYTAVVEEFENDDIIYMNTLKEFEGSEGTLPIGNISCNEIDINFMNINDRFFPGNTDSDIHTFIKRNRKIEPFLGFQYKNGDKEYIPQGLYWSGGWSVSDKGTGAQTAARDRFELLRKTDFPNASVFPTILFNVTIKSLMQSVLVNLQSYMHDFFFNIDDMDDSYIVPVFLPVFFDKMTYFEVIKELTAASLSYSFMDTPTAAETAANGPLMKDIMRTQKLDTVLPPDADLSTATEITQDDFIDKNQPEDTESLANIINVIYTVFTEDPEKPGEYEDEELVATARNEASISEYGELSYEYAQSDIIQEESHAQKIADNLIDSFSITRRDIEINAFGDITWRLGEQINIPEYQKNGIDKRGVYVITKLNSMYDGPLRIAVNGRKIKDLLDDDTIIDESQSNGVIDEKGVSTDDIDEK